MKKERIGFFGGCFNPPTNTHINLASSLIKEKILDKVVFVPVGNYYEKQNLALATDRYNMLKLACKEYKNLEVEDLAIKHKEKLYATDTFELIRNKYQDSDIYFLMGMDNFQKMPLWKNYNEIIEKYKFIIIERLNYNTINNICKNVIYYKTNPIEDVSSTQIRNMIAKNININQWLDKKVIDYIKQNKLYVL